MKKINKLIILLLSLLIAISLFGCGSKKEEPLLTESNLIGKWTFKQGNLYPIKDAPPKDFEIYKGGTATLHYEEYTDSNGEKQNSVNSFTWEIISESEVVNIKMDDFLGIQGTKRGFELVKVDNTLELHSVDGKIILLKDDEEGNK